MLTWKNQRCLIRCCYVKKSFLTGAPVYPEVVCHEFTHGVIENLNQLGNQGEAGAINESIADVVGIVFKRTVYMKDDWKIDNLRDLSEPLYTSSDKVTRFKKYGDIRKLEFGETSMKDNDYEYVHDNSNFLSHAFYLASSDLSASRADIDGKGLLKIWWEAVTQLEDKEKNFIGFIRKTIQIGDLNGRPFGDAIRRAWHQVGVSSI